MQKPITFTAAGAWRGARASLPLFISDAAIGVVFGVLSRQAGLNLVEALLMSMLVFAGSAQFVALSLWGATLPTVTIIFTTFIINIRYLLMGSALHRWLSPLSRAQIYGSLFFLSDENWALTMRNLEFDEQNGAFLLGSGLSLFTAWAGGTTIGQLVGAVISDPAKWGLDFAFPAVFAALLVGMWKGKSNLLPWIVAAAVALVTAYLLPGQWYIVSGGIVGSIVGGLQRDA